MIAEGIETLEQRQALMELGCEFGQGFHLARPAQLGELVNAMPAAGDGGPAPAPGQPVG